MWHTTVVVAVALFGAFAAVGQPTKPTEEEPTTQEILQAMKAMFAQFFADSPLRKENPNELSTVVLVSDDCPLPQETANEAVNGVLIRSRIKPAETSKHTRTFSLWVTADCLKAKTAFTIRAAFMERVGNTIISYEMGYGTYGTFGGDADYLLGAIKRVTEEAVTDYLKANFDLAPSK